LIQTYDQPLYAIATLSRAAAFDGSLSKTVGQLQQNLAMRAVDPDEKTYAGLGVIYVGLGEFELAESALSRAYDLNPAYAEALAYLAYSRSRLSRPALGAMHQALAMAPHSPVVHYLAGLTWMQFSRPDQARAEFQAAYDLDPQNPAFAVEIAETLRAQGAEKYAEIWYQEAIHLAPHDVRLQILLAQFYVDDNYQVQETALPFAQSLVTANPDNAQAHEVLGWIYYRLGASDQALIQLGKSIELDPRQARAQLHRAMLYESLGDVELAIQYYRRAADLDPRGSDGALAQRALHRLGSQ
jgi:tetratricopeptide (TPR) repeat protein